MYEQLTLNLCINDQATFSNFFTGKNQQLINILFSLDTNIDIPFVYIWGKPGSGKSHILGALSQLFNEKNLTASYLPLEDLSGLSSQVLDNLENFDLLCVDDLNMIEGNSVWEEKFFHCFNRIIEYKKKIVITANNSPYALNLQLSDLKSRMTGGLIFELQELSDQEKIESLKQRAEFKGLSLSDLSAQFLLRHYARDTKSLFDTLNKLDRAALAAQRKLTIPFIKSVLEQ